MKRLITILLSFALSFNCFAENVASGSKSAYPHDDIPALTSAPQGYTAFYINHIGRHGSRYISKPKNEDITLKILNLANQEQQLTPQGEILRQQVNRIISLNQHNYGQLSELGKQDMQEMGARVLDNNKTVFSGKHIEVLTTTVPRAIASANAFLVSFHSLYPTITIKQQPEDAQTTLRFFEYSPAFENYKESKSLKDLSKLLEKSAQTKLMSQNVVSKIFTPEFIAQLDEGIVGIDKGKIKTHEFTLALFALYQELLSFTPQLLTNNQLDFDAYFNDQQKQWLTAVITVKNYLQIGPAFNANGIQIKIAAPLLLDIIETTDNAITNQNIDANFRFAHAETVSPLATLLELDGTTQITDAIDDYPKYWQAEKIIPMGANIQFIFYKSQQPTQPILVKVLLNEREVHLPIKTNHYPYYEWQAVKQFYTQKLISLGIDLNQPPLAVLKNLN